MEGHQGAVAPVAAARAAARTAAAAAAAVGVPAAANAATAAAPAARHAAAAVARARARRPGPRTRDGRDGARVHDARGEGLGAVVAELGAMLRRRLHLPGGPGRAGDGRRRGGLGGRAAQLGLRRRRQPLVLERLLGRHALLCVPLKALRNEVHEQLVGAAHGDGERPRAGLALAPLAVGDGARVALRVEEEPQARRLRDHTLRRHPQDLHDARQLLHLVLTGEQRQARIQLRQDTPCNKPIRPSYESHSDHND